MALVAWQGTIQDDSGAARSNASIEVRSTKSGTPLKDLFSDADGTTALTNPFTTGADGFAQFYTAPDTVTVAATADASTQTWTVELAQARPVIFDTVSDMLDDTVSAFETGQIVEAGGFRYKVVASDGHLTSTGGTEFDVLPVAGSYYLEAWGVETNKDVVTGSATLPSTGIPDVTTELVSAVSVSLEAQCPLILPMGAMLCTDALVLKTYTGNTSDRTVGPTIRGQSKQNTVIIYEPSDATVPMIYNNNAILAFDIRDIRFHTSTANTTFWDSFGQGVSQGHMFRQCMFTGSWTTIFKLSRNSELNLDGNNNSEYLFENCRTGIYNNNFKFLHVTASDQNLNYWFRNCSLWGNVQIAHMEKGGHVYVHDCDVSGNRPETDWPLFRLDSTGHSLGVLNVKVDGLRIEAKQALNGPTGTSYFRLLKSNWGNYGNVIFRNVDMSSQSSVITLDAPLVDIGVVNNSSPIYTFSDCQLMGQIDIAASTNSYQYAARATFDRCTFLDYDTPEGAFVVTSTGGRGAIPSVELLGCRGPISSNREMQWDCNVGYAERGIVAPKLRTAQFRASDGFVLANPSTLSVTLPVGATITKFRVIASVGFSSSNTPTFTLTNGDSTTVATVTASASLATGFVEEADPVASVARLTTDNKREITLSTDSNYNQSGPLVAVVEYLA